MHHPFCLNSTDKGLPFLGYVLFPKTVLLNNCSRKRFKTKMKQYTYKLNNSEWNQAEYQAHILALIAFAKHANTYKLSTLDRQNMTYYTFFQCFFKLGLILSANIKNMQDQLLNQKLDSKLFLLLDLRSPIFLKFKFVQYI